MANQILAVISLVLTITIGLWRFFRGKEAEKKKKIDEALNEVKEGIKTNDPSRITAGFDRINRL